MVLVTIL